MSFLLKNNLTMLAETLIYIFLVKVMIWLCGAAAPNIHCHEISSFLVPSKRKHLRAQKDLNLWAVLSHPFSGGPPLFLFLTFRFNPLNIIFWCWHELKPVAAWREGNISTYGRLWKAVSSDVKFMQSAEFWDQWWPQKLWTIIQLTLNSQQRKWLVYHLVFT